MKPLNDHNLSLWQRINARAYCFCVFFVAVFYVKNDYFDTLGEKARIVVICAVLVLVSNIIILFFSKQEINVVKTKKNLIDIFVLLFGVVAFISSILSQYRKDAFLGIAGFSVGGYLIILLVCMYFWISRCYFSFRYDNNTRKELEILYFIVLSSATLEIFLCILNILGIDPFKTYMKTGVLYSYLGTIGNVNNLAGYISMMMSLFTGLLLVEKCKINYILNIIGIVFGWCLVLFCQSDGAFLGVAVGQVFFILICLLKKSYVKPLIFNLFTISITLLVADILSHSILELNIRMDRIASLVLINKLYFFPLIVAIFMIIVTYKKNAKEIDRILNFLSITYIILLLSSIVIVFFGIVYNFDDTFGSGRGYIWRISINIVKTYNIKELLIGVGPECYSYKSMTLFGEEIVSRFGLRLANAHCDYLNFLVTTGILGLISYIGIFTSIIYDFIKTFKSNSEYSVDKIAIFLAIVGYLGQSWMENQMALTFAILMFFVAWYRVLCE